MIGALRLARAARLSLAPGRAAARPRASRPPAPRATMATPAEGGALAPGGAVITVDPSTYEAQLAAKRAEVEPLFAALALPPAEIFRSAPEHYRMRCV